MSFNINIKNESFGYDNSDLAVLNRKYAKTCVEKKRRDRINRCLDELKDIMSQSEDKAKYQKMEKAEILEMAVSYMRTMKSAPSATTDNTNSSNPMNTTQYYTLAYRQCLGEFQTYLSQLPDMQDSAKAKILNHMSQRYIEMLSTINNTKSNINNSTVTNSTTASPDASMTHRRKYKRARYSPYSDHQSTSNNPQDSFSSSSYNLGGSCSSLEQSPEYSNDAHDFSGSSSPSLSQCSSPMSCSKPNDNASSLNISSEENVWRPW